MQNKVEIQILILAGNNPSVSHTAATSPYTGEAIFLYRPFASPVFGEAMVCGELFYLIAADGAYIKNTAAAVSENRLYHFFIVG